MPSPVQVQSVEQMVPNMEVARLFAELQNLKHENQMLRRETIDLLKSYYWRPIWFLFILDVKLGKGSNFIKIKI